MENSSSEFFPRCGDDQFWCDRERVKLLIDLYHGKECLWNIKSKEYKNQTKKKAAKTEIATHFGMSGTLHFFL
jgi:hypothetical protein